MKPLGELPYPFGEYSGPVHVWSDAPDPAQCYRLKDGRLHLPRRGGFAHLLDGSGYILASPQLAEVLRPACGGALTMVPAQVIDLRTEMKLADYFDVLAPEEVTPETISTINVSGRRAWHFNRSNLFVTKEVVVELLRARIPHLQFTPGFGEFCGAAAGAERR